MAKIQVRRGTADQWLSGDPVLLFGEPAFDDAGVLKIGDGIRPWSLLPAHVGGGVPVYIQQADPEVTNPEYEGAAVWYQTDGAGNIIGKKVRV